ncbi:MAG: DUF1343 domain-containing protein [Leptospirales bacterium]|nr:DUF1343 domain-containing protein [Leptospirales bacterium]
MKRRFLYVISFFLLSTSCVGGTSYVLPVNESRVYMGLENFLKDTGKYKDKKCLLVTNHSGIDRDMNSNIDLLISSGIDISFMMAPEHGLHGYQNNYAEEIFTRDSATGLLVYNMHKLDQAKFNELIKGIDIIIFDIQDMGMRCYTYISNLKFIMDAINNGKTELIILDRPDPIAFLGIDGPFLDQRFSARFISAFPAPLIYDMTIAEAALYYKGEYAKNVKLTVFKMSGYKRNMFYHNTSMPWIPPSPNLPTYTSAIVYSSVVLMECINMSLGRGTPMPFEYIGAPWIDPVKFSADLGKMGFEAFRFRPVYFTPNSRKYSGQTCGGTHIIYTGKKFNPTEMAYKIIRYLFENYSDTKWESFGGKYSIDTLVGTDKFRLSITQRLSFEEYGKLIEDEVNEFRKKRKNYILYP